MTFMPGVSGNPSGRRPGSKTRKQAVVEELFEAEVRTIAAKAVELAVAGNCECIRIILDRCAPVRRGRPVRFALPAVNDVGDVLKAFNAILRAAANGTLTLEEASSLGGLIEAHSRAVVVRELEDRVVALEGRLS